MGILPPPRCGTGFLKNVVSKAFSAAKYPILSIGVRKEYRRDVELL